VPPNRRVTVCITTRDGRWRFQPARNVVVAGYAVETPRLLLASANDAFPNGLANGSPLVGKKLDQAVFRHDGG
jgi:choline dehydrogenase-like flavoprotein